MSQHSRRRKSRHAEGHGGGAERWLISYADFITLLFAFFTVLYATSERNVKKQKDFESSVRQSFQAFIPNGTPSGPGEYSSYNKNASAVAPPLDMYQHKSTNTSYEDELRLELQRRLGKEKFGQLVESTQAESNGVRISLAGKKIFSTGSSKLSADSLNQLDVLADVLSTTGKRLVVEGHIDEGQKKNGSDTSNWDLASARATTLVRYLIAKSVPADRLSAVAYAEQQGTTSKSAKADSSHASRIDIVVQTSEP